MFSEIYSSPIYQLDQSLDQTKYYCYYEYDNDNTQREMNNNITLNDNIETRNYLDNSEKKIEGKENNFLNLDLNKNQEGDNFNGEDLEIPTEKNQFKYMPEKKLPSLGNLNTKATSVVVGKKRKRSSEKVGQTESGRKTKDSNIKGKHNKFSEDNMMRKIKTNFFKYINGQLNAKLKNKYFKFLKLDSKISENLKKDFNDSLMKTKIKDIYLNTEISSKYRTQIKNNHDTNIKIIEEIYSEREEIDVINTLELTYIDLFGEFKNNYLDQFLNRIKKEEEDKKESEKDINAYIDKIKSLCLNYDGWFNDKKGRNRNKNYE